MAQQSANPGDSFVLITDPALRFGRGSRKEVSPCVPKSADIGGRYSALSYFGMVPAALMGLDVSRLLDSALTMAKAGGPDVPSLKILALSWVQQLASALTRARQADLITSSSVPAWTLDRAASR